MGLLFAFLAGAAGTARAETWAIQSVDVGSAAPGPSSLVLIRGYPVISYFGAPRSLKFAALDRPTNRWVLRRVDAGGEYSSIAVDSSGIAHVGYIDANSLELRHWRYNAGVGSIQVIDSETGLGGMNFFNSIQVDAAANPRISYFQWRAPDGSITGRLKYATLGGTAWSTGFVDTSAGRGKYNSLALDASGNPQIAYYDAAAGSLRLATRVALLWTTQVVDSIGDPGWLNSMAIDATGRPHLSYIAAIPLQIRYATRNGAVWSFQDVAGVGPFSNAWATSLALDSSGNPHIAYYDAAATSLRYASRSGATWTVQTVDLAGDVGGYCSLRMDTQNRPIISYYDATSQSLKIAYGDYPDQDLDGIPDAFDPCPTNADCNSNGVVDGREGGYLVGAPVTRLKDEPIFGCGSIALLYAGGPRGGPPPADMLFLLGPALYVLLRRGRSSRPSARA